jgi:tetratricopeptide (TPR) repeat protein
MPDDQPSPIFIATDGLSAEEVEQLEAQIRKDNPLGWADGKLVKGELYLLDESGDRRTKLEQSTSLIQQALQEYTEAQHPVPWATSQFYLGQALYFLYDLSHGDEIEAAIEHLQDALRVYTFGRYPEEWMLAHFLIALAYKKRPLGARSQNLARSAAHLTIAMSLLDASPRFQELLDGFKTELRAVRILVERECAQEIYDFFISFHGGGFGAGAAELLDGILGAYGWKAFHFGREPIAAADEALYERLREKLFLSRHLIVVVDRALSTPGAADWIKWEVRTFLTERDRRVFVIHVGGVLRTPVIEWKRLDQYGSIWHCVVGSSAFDIGDVVDAIREHLSFAPESGDDSKAHDLDGLLHRYSDL